MKRESVERNLKIVFNAYRKKTLEELKREAEKEVPLIAQAYPNQEYYSHQDKAFLALNTSQELDRLNKLLQCQDIEAIKHYMAYLLHIVN